MGYSMFRVLSTDELNVAVLAGASSTAILIVLALIIVVLLLCLRCSRRDKRLPREQRRDRMPIPTSICITQEAATRFSSFGCFTNIS